MAILKCKMCGGDIIATEGQTFGICDSCGSTVTLPNVNDHRMENLFNRANHFRMISEFDKAVATYEMILNEEALFKKFCKRDFCDEVRDFKIPEPEAVAS